MIHITRSNKGILLVILSTILWAINGNMGSYLFKYKGITPEHLTMFRLVFAGLILLVYEHCTQKRQVFNIFKDKNNLNKLFFFAFFGILFMQYGYFAAIKYSNAATATTLQSLSPFIILVVTSIWMKKLPTKNIVLALLFALIGTFMLITHGKINELAITKAALFYGLLAAFGYANYNLISIPLQKKYKTSLIVGWGMFISGIGFTILFNPLSVPITMTFTTLLGIIYIVVLGTLFPLLFYLIGAKLIGIQKASILGLIEPVTSTIIAVLFLGENFIILDYTGIILVIFALYLLTSKKEVREKLV